MATREDLVWRLEDLLQNLRAAEPKAVALGSSSTYVAGLTSGSVRG